MEVGNAVAALWANVVHEWSKSGEKAGKNKGKAFSEVDIFLSGYPEVLSAHSFSRWSSQRHLTLNPMWLMELRSTLQDHLPEASAWTCLLVQYYIVLLSLSARERTNGAGLEDELSGGGEFPVVSPVLGKDVSWRRSPAKGTEKSVCAVWPSAMRGRSGSLPSFRDSDSTWHKCFQETKT